MSAVLDRPETAAVVARQNDAFRLGLIHASTENIPGRALITHGVVSLGIEVAIAVQIAVAAFSEFTQDNDPHGDHTFGVVEVAGQRVFWKIDLYDENYKYGSEDPADLTKTARVLTIFLPSEY